MIVQGMSFAILGNCEMLSCFLQLCSGFLLLLLFACLLMRKPWENEISFL